MGEYLDILIVEDDRDWQSKLRMYLEEHNYRIEVAASTDEAIVVLCKSRCHVVILDMRLDEPSQKDSGIKVLEHLSQHSKTTKAIVLTGYGDIAKATKIQEQFGVLAYLDKKTFEPEELKRLVQEVLAHQFRCFKTGGECNRKIRFKPHQVFVAMPYRSDLVDMDDVYFGIQIALQELGYKPLRADEKPVWGRDLMCNVCKFIQESVFGIVDITDWNPNVLLELGMMLGWGKTAVIIKYEQSEVPSDLQGALYIEYANIGSLKKKLKSGLPNLEL